MTEQEARQLRPGMMVKVVEEWPDDPMILKPAESMLVFAGKIVTISKVEVPKNPIASPLLYIEESDTGEYWVSTDFEYIVEDSDDNMALPVCDSEDIKFFLSGG